MMNYLKTAPMTEIMVYGTLVWCAIGWVGCTVVEHFSKKVSRRY